MTDRPLLLFQVVANELKERLSAGQYPLGIPLPGERDLAKEFKVARVTVRTALQRLQEEGLVTRLRGVGTMPIKEVSTRTHPNIQTGLLESIVSFGQRSRTRLISYGLTKAAPDIADALKIPEGSPVLKIIRVRTIRKIPFQCTEVYLPIEVAALISQADLGDMPILSLIEKAGLRYERGEQELKAVNACAAQGLLLKIEANTPVLQVKRTVYDAVDRPIQYLIGHYSSHHYQYMMSMSRTGGSTRVWIAA